jgi:hypothetical protein
MTRRIEVRSFALDDATIRKLDHRKRSQLLGCMHAHNELTFLSRLLVFSQTPVSEGNLHDQAQTSQMWCVFQLLAGKLYETWIMLSKRFVFSHGPQRDAVVRALNQQHQASLQWLLKYFSPKGINKKPIVMLRNKTAFHYGGLDMAEALHNLVTDEKTFHIAPHPANTLYWVGSAAVFGAVFAEIATIADPVSKRPHAQCVNDGFNLLQADVGDANIHMHALLYGLIKGLTEDVMGHPLGDGELTIIDGVPGSKDAAIPPWLYIENAK